mgnify:CR=1 FL=1
MQIWKMSQCNDKNNPMNLAWFQCQNWSITQRGQQEQVIYLAIKIIERTNFLKSDKIIIIWKQIIKKNQ